MFNVILFISYLGMASFCRAEKLLGEGIWSLKNIGACTERLNTELVKFDIKKHKMNRTHDGLDVHITVDVDIDNTYGALLEICKYVHGGCKPQVVFTDLSLANMLDKYARDNRIELFTEAKLDPPDFPVPKGDYITKDYVFSYCKLPRDGVYGEYGVKAYLTHGGEKVACLDLNVELNELDDDNQICDGKN